MKIWFDTEFIEDGKTIDLLSIGMIRLDGQTYYAEPAEADRSRAGEWVQKNVLPHLRGPIKPRAQIAAEIIEFAGDAPEFWAYYAAYDWVVLCQLYGTMMDLPKGWPMFCRDVIQECKRLGNPALPKMQGTTHNALDDAIWCRQAWGFLVSQEE